MTTTSGELRTVNAQIVNDVMRFHGHECPGAAVGIRVAEAALAVVGCHSRTNQITAVVETNLCAVDPIQYLTGCTFGKRNLIHLDHGKNVFTFWQRSSHASVRIVVLPDSVESTDPEFWNIHERIHEGAATDDEQSFFAKVQATRYRNILEMELNQLCRMEAALGPPPRRIGATAPTPCSSCGELTLGTHISITGEGELCRVCVLRSTREQVPQ
jgi:formylmethanofuran dehydrogenase subunit E